MFELAKPGLAIPRMIRPIDLNDVGYFGFLSRQE